MRTFQCKGGKFQAGKGDYIDILLWHCVFVCVCVCVCVFARGQKAYKEAYNFLTCTTLAASCYFFAVPQLWVRIVNNLFYFYLPQKLGTSLVFLSCDFERWKICYQKSFSLRKHNLVKMT